MEKVYGFQRKQGRPGIRNLVAVMYTVNCARTVSERIAYDFYESRALGFFSCTRNASAYKSLVALGTHPNVGAVLVVSLGCEGTEYRKLVEELKASGRDVELIVIQKAGGTTASVKKGREIVDQMIERLKKNERCEIKISDLVLGIECGGSDATSGLVANTSAGKTADVFVSEGGAVIVEEFKELFGCEQILEDKTDEEVIPKLRKALDNALRYAQKTGYYALSPGNIEGGLTTIDEKSLGAACKLGTSNIKGILSRSEEPVKEGLYLLNNIYEADRDKICLCYGGDTFGNSTLTESHCHIIIFTTGRGNVLGAALTPVIKVTGNSDTYHRMIENMDINAGEILEGNTDIDEMGEKIFNKVIEVAGGKLTKSEIVGHFESIVSCQW